MPHPSETVIQKLIFAAAHYAAVVVFGLACWGLGRAWLARLGAPARRDAWLEAAITTAAGFGIVICLFQLLAIFSLLVLPAVVGVVAIGLAAAALHAPGWLRQARTGAAAAPPWTWLDKLALGALALVALPALVAPLAPPAVYDELMYHLPYAREVAQSGSLAVVDWLRYPWFPYNFNLLYAGALQVGDDVLPHLVSVLAGWLSVCMVYRLGLVHANRLTGAVAAAIWLGIGDYTSALIDTSVALFILSACAVLWWWRETDAGRGARWLALAAFFLGVAAGSKYQALTVLPLLAVFVVRRERRPWVWGVALLCFLVPCVYWYVRNALMTGDPFNPIGGRLFGFTNWNLADYRNQLNDVQVHAAWPNAFLWGVLFAPFGVLWKRSPGVRAAGVFSLYSIVVWALTSRYPRYLFASVPLMALVAVVGWQVVFRWLYGRVHRLVPRWSAGGALDRAGRWVGVLLLAAGLGVSWHLARQRTANIAVTEPERAAFLEAHVPGYAVMDYLRRHPVGRTYQVALSEAIYYGPVPVWGDALGPWRYTDFITGAPADNARKLAAQGFGAIAVDAATAPKLESQPGFFDHFALLYEKDGAKAYRILAFQHEPKS